MNLLQRYNSAAFLPSYGSPVVVLNLVKQRPRHHPEVGLATAYEASISTIQAYYWRQAGGTLKPDSTDTEVESNTETEAKSNEESDSHVLWNQRHNSRFEVSHQNTTQESNIRNCSEPIQEDIHQISYIVSLYSSCSDIESFKT